VDTQDAQVLCMWIEKGLGFPLEERWNGAMTGYNRRHRDRARPRSSEFLGEALPPSVPAATSESLPVPSVRKLFHLNDLTREVPGRAFGIVGGSPMVKKSRVISKPEGPKIAEVARVHHQSNRFVLDDPSGVVFLESGGEEGEPRGEEAV